MPDYKELYLSMFRAMEKAISLLIEAQRRAEETILSEEDIDIILLHEKTSERNHTMSDSQA